MYIRCKKKVPFSALKSADPYLIILFGFVYAQFMEHGYEFVLTETRRKARSKHDVHATDILRAIDARTFHVPKSVIDQIMTEINLAFLYDPVRPQKPIVYYHKSKSGGYHFHMQVHPRTLISIGLRGQKSQRYQKSKDLKRS